VFEKRPAAQTVQYETPLAECFPAGHWSQDLAPTDRLYLPAGHFVAMPLAPYQHDIIGEQLVDAGSLA
jgi:hypothetical protein